MTWADIIKISICALLVALGIVFHFIVKLSELESQGQIISPRDYWKQHPYTSLAVIMGAYLYMAFEASVGELGYSGAILIGIACNALGDKLRARAQAQLK